LGLGLGKHRRSIKINGARQKRRAPVELTGLERLDARRKKQRAPSHSSGRPQQTGASALPALMGGAN